MPTRLRAATVALAFDVAAVVAVAVLVAVECAPLGALPARRAQRNFHGYVKGKGNGNGRFKSNRNRCFKSNRNDAIAPPPPSPGLHQARQS